MYCAGRARVVRETNASVFLCRVKRNIIEKPPEGTQPLLSHCASFAGLGSRLGAWRTRRRAGSKSIIVVGAHRALARASAWPVCTGSAMPRSEATLVAKTDGKEAPAALGARAPRVGRRGVTARFSSTELR
jgi:hypothetical protein